MTNEDFDTASRAYRQAVAQGAQSRFKDAESNLGLAHALISKGSEKGWIPAPDWKSTPR